MLLDRTRRGICIYRNFAQERSGGQSIKQSDLFFLAQTTFFLRFLE